MESNCLNCSQPITTNFCGNCGQKKYKRIDRKYIWDEVQYTFIHTNKGFLYSVKNILKNPGKTAREFIDGNRVNHYKPILLAFVLSGISAFISYKILGMADVVVKNFQSEKYAAAANSQFMHDYMSLITSYNSFIMLLSIPFFSFFTYLSFKKWGHNYYEHIVINSYVLSFYTLSLIILFYPILFFLKGQPATFYNVSMVSLLLTPLLLVFFFKEFYNNKPLKAVILRVLALIGLIIIGAILLFIAVVILGVIIAMLKGPEALEYLAPQKH
ncbi:DUF3667 domain-containing protein [Chryseobacterium camelliae]|uniref:DUF3667 domain-containing protein n=1 Tax=Chryseobacterium camelliae TaxID=1265445 RepID=A0ABY7QLJ2_9FLAO|nr:DUF3667 domain-containing protein [Chryseobacterium camelliae]WBV60558.1 DUF3667 domain-containing protein [Chryseobacterium camelliae]